MHQSETHNKEKYTMINGEAQNSLKLITNFVQKQN